MLIVLKLYLKNCICFHFNQRKNWAVFLERWEFFLFVCLFFVCGPLNTSSLPGSILKMHQCFKNFTDENSLKSVSLEFHDRTPSHISQSSGLSCLFTVWESRCINSHVILIPKQWGLWNMVFSGPKDWSRDSEPRKIKTFLFLNFITLLCP